MAVLQLFVLLLVVGPADAVIPLLVVHGRHEGVHLADFLAVVIGDKEFEAMVFLPEDGILPTGVWKPVFLSPAYPEAMSSLPAGWASDDTIRFCTRFTGRTAVRSFRLFGAFVVEEASGSFPL